MIARDDAITELTSEPFDLVVVGGGVTGAGVALDAASRGYSVAIVERHDWAIGTSSRSSKMVHGGLRYLQNFDLGLVREALLERQLLVHLAPHLVYPTPFLVPALGDDRRNIQIGLGLNLYDVMATTRVGQGRSQRSATAAEEESWAPHRHRVIERDEVLELAPALEPREPTSAYMFYDCQTDDVRLVLTILREAQRFGALCANRIEVSELLMEGGKARGVIARDTESGDELEIKAQSVVNATGVWADRLRPEEILDEEEVPRIAPSRGTHVTIAREDLPLNAACIVPAGQGRSIFALPWYTRTLVGTTDADYDGDIDQVQPGGEDVAYLLEAVNRFFATSLGPGDLTGAYAGVRPLISTGDPKKSVDISRKAELYETSSGMLTITGGKLTTWRRMAKQVVDRMVERDGREAPCRTAEIPLGLPAEDEDLAAAGALALPAGAPEQLAFRYGHRIGDVLELVQDKPELAEPIVEGQPDLRAEVVLAARSEQAASVADVLLRRTRLGLLAAKQLDSAESVAEVAALLGVELGWNKRRIEKESAAWVEVAAAEGIDPSKSLT